ncbi:MAG: hypothetical protein RRA35_07755 [Desulfomonilia bacterium]|nr:hypothetical protein [Desulfomonilia bacterium]
MNKEEVVQLLSDHEHAIGDLYREYARLFPRHQELWESCAQEEAAHAQMVLTLHELLKKGEITFTGRFNAAALKTSMNYISQQIERAQEGLLAAKEAYSIALSIESGLLENRYFDAFTGNTPPFVSLRQTLLEETARHRNQIQELLTTIRKLV